jgi:hypothetical protein
MSDTNSSAVSPTSQYLSNLQTNPKWLEDTLANPEPVSYLVAGNLVTGIRGQREGQSGSSYTYVLQVVSPEGGNSTHLIWAQTEREITELRIRDTLASLALRS